MARTTYVVNYTDAATTEANIKKILTGEKFELVFEKGENAWKRGSGILSCIQYVTYEFIDHNTLHITGWVKSDMGGEFNLDGYLLGHYKKKTRDVIQRIKAVIK